MLKKKKEKKLRGFQSSDFHHLQEIASPSFSPDGTKIICVLQRIEQCLNEYRKNLFLMEKNGTNLSQFTFCVKGNDTQPAWSPQGDQIAFISNRDGKNQIWIIPLQGGEAYQLTTMKNGVESFAWSPDGKSIAFIARLNSQELLSFNRSPSKKTAITADEREFEQLKEKKEEKKKIDPRIVDRIVYRTGTIFRDDRHSHLFVINLSSRKVSVITREERDFSQPAWSSDGQFLYSWANFTDDEDNNINTDIVRITLADLSWKQLTHDQDANASPVVSTDGRYCYYLSLSGNHPNRHNNRIKRLNLQTGETCNIASDFFYEIEDFSLDSKGENLYFISLEKGSAFLYQLELDSKEYRQLTEKGGAVLEYSLAPSNDKIACIITKPDIPSDLYVYDIKGKSLQRQTKINDKFLRKKAISLPEELWWKTDDGMTIQGWVMKPINFDAQSKYPCIVEIHGGPHVMWGNTFWLEFQIMTSRGYVVFFCNPRGSEGYGTDFKGATYQNWGVDDSKDIMQGLGHVIKLGFVDQDNLFITGGSYGGFMTAWIIGHDNRFKAAVAQRGVYNLTSFYGCSDAQLLIEWEFDTFPWENPELLWKHSPLAYAPAIKTPLLIIHSELDYRAPINTAEELFTALKKLNRDVLFVRYPREGHELSRSGEPNHRVDRLERIVSWFDKYKSNDGEKTEG